MNQEETTLICDSYNVEEISVEPSSVCHVGITCTDIGCDNFLICDKCMDNNKDTENAKSIHRFTYPKWDDLVYCYSYGFAFKAAHSKLQECDICMTNELPYTLC